MVCRFVYNLRFAFSPDSQQKPGLEKEKICFFLLIQFQWGFLLKKDGHLSTSKHIL